jgi:hypothetical protein
MPTDFGLLQSVLRRLGEARFADLIFGGRVGELPGLFPSRCHRDVDLLRLDPDHVMLDRLLGKSLAITEKRSSQKRAFVVEGILMELFITRTDGTAQVRWFSDHLRWPWPVDVVAHVASPSS